MISSQMPLISSLATRSLAWAAGAGPGEGPLTIDLDSTMCETYGLANEGARHHGYTGQRGYHPLLAIAAGTGEVLMSRLREGRANTVRGAAHFLRETVGRVRHAGARGQLTVQGAHSPMALTTIQGLRTHLQWAVQVELTTIPTYLYAMYSIKDQTSESANVFRSVVVEEMLHVALASNLLELLRKLFSHMGNVG